MGRPAGRRNYQRIDVAIAEPQCPRCGSTDRKDTRRAGASYRPVEIAGRTYTHTVTLRATCADCGAPLKITCYRYDPRHAGPPRALA
jgi:hypothetical protein